MKDEKDNGRTIVFFFLHPSSFILPPSSFILSESFDGHAFGQVAGLVHIAATQQGNVVSEQL